MNEATLSRNSSSFTWGGDGPPRTLPKIPLFGPAAQLSPQVLLTRLHELDAISVGQGRLKPGALTPRAPPSEQRQLTLPTLQGAGATTAGKFYVSGSHSARGPREASATLAAMLYKGDHTHCLPEVHGLRPRTPPTDGVAPRPARGRGGTPATPAADLNASAATLTVSDTASVKGLSPSPSSLISLATTVPPMVAKLAHRAKKVVETTPEELVRRAALRSSFKHEASAVDSAMSRLRRWQMLIDMQELLDSDEQTRMQGLLDRLENSGLQMLPPRHNADAATWGGLSDDVQEQPPEDDHERSAPRFELSCCVSVLNFIRWLCGLPPVRLHAIRQVMCKVIAVALLPRLADPQVRLGRGPSDLGDYVAKLVGDEGRINVLHCEASLVLAIEKSIAATHLTTAPTKTQDRETAARALAERVEAAQNAFPPQDIHGVRRPSRPFSSSGAPKEPPPPPPAQLSLSELPPALQPLKVLWELQPRRPGDPAPAVPPVALDAPVPRLEPGKASSVPPPRRAGEGSGRRRLQVRQEALPADGSRPDGDLRRASFYGLSSIWGDRSGALDFRRCLLSPALRDFGAARQQDTCVLWTGADREQDLPVPAADQRGSAAASDRKQQRHSAAAAAAAAAAPGHPPRPPPPPLPPAPDAVCYPPTGICPLSLLEGGKAPWSIMPNGSKFQPTSQTGVRAWRVRIDKAGKEWTAERTEEVPVLGFAVDCSMQGEPFCVIFWPGMARQAANGDQLEVNLFGLCGPVQDLTFFYEFRAFHQAELDASLCGVAVKTRALLGEASLWAEPRPAAVAATPAPSAADDWLGGQSVDSQPAAGGGPAKLPGGGGGKQRQSTHQVSWRQGTRPTGAPGSPGSVNGSITRPPRLETLSHHQTTFSTNSVDLKVLLRGPNAAVLQADLFVVRFGEIEEQVPHGAQVQKLEDSTFIVLAKLPMARCRYELRFKASRKEAPVEMQAHPFKYLILTGEQSPQLLSSLEDPRARIFGYARISPEAQQHGTFILSPMLHRIVVGNCYFLVYVDKALALAPFAEAAAAMAVQQDVLQLPSSRKEARPSPPSSAAAPPAATTAAAAGHAGNARGTTTTLFSKRLLPKDGPYAVSSIVASSRQLEPPKGNPDVADLHQTLRKALEPRTQDVSGDVHMDLLSQSGDCLRQLKERSDFPGLYEGLVRFGDSEVGKVIRLVARFPKAQAAEFAPKTMCEWYVCRADHFPPNF